MEIREKEGYISEQTVEGIPTETIYPPQPVHEQRPYRSLFWPIMLIGVGLIVLLVNMGIIEGLHWGALWRLWPVLLIVAGIDMIFSRSSAFLGAILGLATVAGVIALLVLGSQFNLDTPFVTPMPNLQTYDFSEPLAGVDSADIVIDGRMAEMNIYGLEGSDNLIEARMNDLYPIAFDVSGSSSRHIRISDPPGSGGFSYSNIDPFMDRLVWDIGISPDVPVNLEVNMGIGRGELDLAQLDLSSLQINGDMGGIKASLPAGTFKVDMESGVGSSLLSFPDGYTGDVNVTGDIGEDELITGDDVTFTSFDYEGSIGGLKLEMGANAAGTFDITGDVGLTELRFGDNPRVTIEYEGSIGELVVYIPEGTHVRVLVEESGIGNLALPETLKQTERGEEEKEGTWMTDGFTKEGSFVDIIIKSIDIGSVKVRFR